MHTRANEATFYRCELSSHRGVRGEGKIANRAIGNEGDRANKDDQDTRGM